MSTEPTTGPAGSAAAGAIEHKPSAATYVRPMPSELSDAAENRQAWTDYSWPQGGHEWSEGWGSTDALWCVTLHPRLFAALPARSIVEIAPGFGRISRYLLGHCERYTGVDVTPRCVERCRARFRDQPHAAFELTDGLTLTKVADADADLVISYDSLVHVEQATLSAYLREIARVLRPGGTAFLHHSNLGAYADRLSAEDLNRVPGGRRASASAARVASDAAAVGLRVVLQELIPWHDNGLLTDAFTLLRADPDRAALEPRVIVRDDWARELAHARALHIGYLAGLGGAGARRG